MLCFHAKFIYNKDTAHLACIPAEGPSLPLAPSLPSVLSTAVVIFETCASILAAGHGHRPAAGPAPWDSICLLGTASGALEALSNPRLPSFCHADTHPTSISLRGGPSTLLCLQKALRFPRVSFRLRSALESLCLPRAEPGVRLSPTCPQGGPLYLPGDCLLIQTTGLRRSPTFTFLSLAPCGLPESGGCWLPLKVHTG